MVGQVANALADNIPKVMNRYRQNQAVKTLQEKGSEMTPFEQWGTLDRAGYSGDQINTALPLLQRSNSNAESRRLAQEGSGQGAQPPNQPTPMQQQPPVKQRAQGNQPSQGQPDEVPQEPGLKKLVTPEARHARLNPIADLTPEERRSEGARYNQQYPNRFPTAEAGEAEAVRVNQERQAQQKNLANQSLEQMAARNELIQEIGNRAAMQLNDPETGAMLQQDKIPGPYLQKKIDEAEDMMANGKTAQDAADPIAKDLKEYADLRKSNAYIWGKSPQGTKDVLKRQQKEYAKRDEQRTYVNDLVANQNINRLNASSIAYPLDRKEDKETRDFLNKLDKAELVPKYAKTLLGAGGEKALDYLLNTGEKVDEKSRKVAQQIPIKPGQSLLGMAANLNAKGYNTNSFIDEVSKLYENGKISLDKYQKEELGMNSDPTSTIGDWFLWSLGGLDHIPEEE